jgi:hypothetical protein
MPSPSIPAPAAASTDTARAIGTYVEQLSDAIRRWPDAAASNTADEFEPLARELFAIHFEANPVYRAWCQSRRVSPSTLGSWKAIPGLPAASFKESEVTCLSPERITTVFQSSGTTGQIPSRHFHEPVSLAAYEASFVPWFKFCVLPADPGLVWIPLVPRRSDAPRSSLSYMIEGLLKAFAPADVVCAGALGSGGEWTLDWDRLLAALAASEGSGRSVLLMGTAFNVVHLLDALEAGGRRFQLPAGSMVMETGGYKGRSRVLTPLELSQGIRERLGIDPHGIITEYGMSELSSQAYSRWPDASGPGVLRFPPWARALVISPETGNEVADGGTGLLRILDLANVASVLCLQTEDLAVRRGSDFHLLGRRPEAESRGCSLMSA